MPSFDRPRCGICGEPMKAGEPMEPDDMTMLKPLPDKSIVRVHILCAVKARISRHDRPET